MYTLRLENTKLYYHDSCGVITLNNRSHATTFATKAEALAAAGLAPFVIEKGTDNATTKRKVSASKGKKKRNPTK